jgi:RNA polymerase sigma-70 factor, ECF subfamily
MSSASQPPSVDPRDVELRALIAAGEFERATIEAIEYYGGELIGWLCAILPNEADAQDAFSRMSERLWKSLPTFDGRCSLRAWCYMLARQAASRVRSAAPRRHEELMSHVPSIVGAVTHVWNTTRAEQRRAEDVYAEMRRSLSEEEQTLLVLRVDRELAWRDIALITLGEEANEDQLTRHAAALRKQFMRIKDRLRELAARDD